MLWNVAPKTCTAKALLGSSVICRLDVDPSCRPQILEENVTPKGPKRKFDEYNSSSDPDFWELRHRSNVKYVRRGRQGMFYHPTLQAARVTNCLKHSRGNHQSSSSEVYLHLIRPGKFLPIIHPLQLGST